MERQDEVWKSAALVRAFIEEIRGGVPFAAEQIEMMLRVIAARGEPVRRVADLGCGSGVLAHAILSQYPQAQATLVDFSEPMLDAARAQLAEHRPAPQFVTADLAASEWSARVASQAPYDVIVSGYAIHHLPHERKRQLYHEIFALLSPGGMFINVEHVASRTSRIEAIADDLMIDSLYAFHKRRGEGKTRVQVADAFVHRPDKAANILAPVEAQCEWLRACGFEDVDCFFKVFELAVFGGRRPRTAPDTVAQSEADATGATTGPTPPRSIRSERLLLRVPQIDDAEAIFHGYASDPEVTRFLVWTPSQSVAETVVHLRENVAAWRDGSRFPWVITRLADDAVIGAIELRVAGPTAEIGYVLARAAWGRGYMTEAVGAVIAAALSMPGVFRVWATCDVDNIASARVLEKAGMVKEALLRRAVVHPNISHEPRDAYCYAITK